MYIAIAGNIGSGKTTLMNIIGGLDRKYEGDVIVDGLAQKTKKEKEVLEISKQIVASEKETFEVNQKRQLQEINFEIGKMETQLKSDKEIIQLREKIVRSAEAQMKNGVITSSDYLNEVTQLFESKITEKTHQIQLQLAKANHQIIKGI